MIWIKHDLNNDKMLNMNDLGLYLLDSAFPGEEFSLDEVEKFFEKIDIDNDQLISR